MVEPYVISSPQGTVHIGLHASEIEAWTVCLGWPDDAEIALKKSQGWTCNAAHISWPKPKWKGLSDKERDDIYHNSSPYEDLKKVEQLLKEKNGY